VTTKMRTLRDLSLVEASVPKTATFDEAAALLRSESVSTVAVVDEHGTVVGLFGESDLLRGLFPGYLGELHHTAFTEDDRALLDRRADEVRGEAIAKHMHKPVTIDADASALHIAERFLHSDFGALPVIESGKFVGMLGRADFCRAVLRRFGSSE
jgi:CBS domain-containing protein